jgi:hypothetical protein
VELNPLPDLDYQDGSCMHFYWTACFLLLPYPVVGAHIDSLKIPFFWGEAILSCYESYQRIYENHIPQCASGSARADAPVGASGPWVNIGLDVFNFPSYYCWVIFYSFLDKCSTDLKFFSIERHIGFLTRLNTRHCFAAAKSRHIAV